MRKIYEWMGWCWHDWNRPEPNWTSQFGTWDQTYFKRCEKCGTTKKWP
jgi:hypothetical protein